MAAIKVGIIGYGGSAKSFHLPFILPNPDLEVYAFLQRAPPPPNPSEVKPGTHCTVDFPEAKHYRTADDFFADDQIDLVVVCSSGAHGEFAERALGAGKHVVVEKPFVNTSGEADRLVGLAREVGRVLTVFHSGFFCVLCLFFSLSRVDQSTLFVSHICFVPSLFLFHSFASFLFYSFLLTFFLYYSPSLCLPFALLYTVSYHNLLPVSYALLQIPLSNRLLQ